MGNGSSRLCDMDWCSCRDVVDHLGIDIDMQKQKYLTATGDPLPEDIDDKKVLVERSIPTKRSSRFPVGMGSQWYTIPISHGGPETGCARVFGCNQIKYVKKWHFLRSSHSKDSTYRLSFSSDWLEG